MAQKRPRSSRSLEDPRHNYGAPADVLLNQDKDDCTLDDSNMRKGLPVLGTRLFPLESLFREHGVDLAFWAHEHSYERTWPVYDGKAMNGTTDAYRNPGATTHVIAGAAGCREGHDQYKGPRGPWSAVRLSSFGYGTPAPPECHAYPLGADRRHRLERRRFLLAHQRWSKYSQQRASQRYYHGMSARYARASSCFSAHQKVREQNGETS